MQAVINARSDLRDPVQSVVLLFLYGTTDEIICADDLYAHIVSECHAKYSICFPYRNQLNDAIIGKKFNIAVHLFKKITNWPMYSVESASNPIPGMIRKTHWVDFYEYLFKSQNVPPIQHEYAFRDILSTHSLRHIRKLYSHIESGHIIDIKFEEALKDSYMYYCYFRITIFMIKIGIARGMPYFNLESRRNFLEELTFGFGLHLISKLQQEFGFKWPQKITFEAIENRVFEVVCWLIARGWFENSIENVAALKRNFDVNELSRIATLDTKLGALLIDE